MSEGDREKLAREIVLELTRYNTYEPNSGLAETVFTDLSRLSARALRDLLELVRSQDG